eukprot:UN25211
MKDIIKRRGVFGLYAGVVPPVFFRGFGFAANRYAYGIAKKRTNKTWLIGAVSGFSNSLFDQPVFVLKARVQVSNKKFKETIPNYWRMAKDIWTKEGVRGFMSGYTFMYLNCVISYSIFYVVYDYMRQRDYSSGVSGVAAVVICWPAVYPFDVLRTRQQVMSHRTV